MHTDVGGSVDAKSNRDDSAKMRGIEGCDEERDVNSADRMEKTVEEQKSVAIGLEGSIY